MSDTTVGAVDYDGTAAVQERRQNLRSKMTQIVYMNMEAENGGILLDISLSGLGFQLASPLANENQISFRLSAEGIEDVEILANVAWLDEHRKRGGLRFGQLPEKVGTRIGIWVRHTPAPISDARDRVPVVVPKLFPPTQVSKPAPSRPSLISEMIPYSLTREPSQSFRPPEGGTEGNLGGLANPLRATRNLLQLDSAHQLQFTAQRERHLGAIALAVFTLMAVVGGGFAFANKHEAGELLIHLGERVSGDYSPQSTGEAAALTPGTLSFTSPESSNSAGHAPQAASGQTASDSTAAAPAIASGGSRDVDRPEEPMNRGQAPISPGLNENEAPPVPAAAVTDRSGKSVSGSSPSPSESATNIGQSSRSDSDASGREDGGHTELLLARQYLRGSNIPKDRDMAAHLLWVAIGEGNPQAELELADLYLRSDGVPPKNCAQARILLNDSSNSGNVEAGEQLAKLSDFGCR